MAKEISIEGLACVEQTQKPIRISIVQKLKEGVDHGITYFIENLLICFA